MFYSPVKVYNFEVEVFHTYYVGNGDGVLVHNTCKPTSLNQMQEQVKRQQVPKEIIRIDGPKESGLERMDGGYSIMNYSEMCFHDSRIDDMTFLDNAIIFNFANNIVNYKTGEMIDNCKVQVDLSLDDVSFVLSKKHSIFRRLKVWYTSEFISDKRFKKILSKNNSIEIYDMFSSIDSNEVIWRGAPIGTRGYMRDVIEIQFCSVDPIKFHILS